VGDNMGDKKLDQQEITSDILITDAMLRITALEKLLIEKGVFTQAELTAATEEIAKKAAQRVLEKAKSSKDIQDFISKLEAITKDKKDLKN
jgi:TPP-dependent pyruvate/acetoin dehydrogenase alpha subunit